VRWVVCAEYDSEEVNRTLCCTMCYHEDPTYRKQCLNDAYGCDRRMHRHPLCELGRPLCEFMRADFEENGWPLCPMTEEGNCSLAPNAHGADWYAQRELAWNHRLDRPSVKKQAAAAQAQPHKATAAAGSGMRHRPAVVTVPQQEPSLDS
jgi:hypothetical protein